MSQAARLESQPLGWRAWLIAALIFFVTIPVYHDEVDFAYFYHVDEPTKVAQIKKNERNYFHPLLLMNTAGLIHQLQGKPQNPQEVVQAGRLASAIFSAAALALAVLVCWQHGSWVAAVVGFFAIFFDRALYEFAHYFKEDPAMNFGLALFCFAVARYHLRPTLGHALLIGIGVGAALSGKYLGAITLLFAVWMILRRPPLQGSKLKMGAIFLGGLLLTVSIINWQIFLEWPKFLQGFTSEIGRVQNRYGDAGAFQERAWKRIMIAFPPLTLALLGAYLLSPLYRRKGLDLCQWIIVLLPLTFGALLFSASQAGGRYNSPILLCTLMACAIAAGWITQALAQKFATHRKLALGLGTAAFVGLFAATKLEDFATCWSNIRYDSRHEMLRFVDDNLPASAYLAEEYDANLGPETVSDTLTFGLETPRRRYVTKYKLLLPDVTSLDALRDKGVTHVVLVWSNEKKRLSSQGPDTWADLSVEQRRRNEFYYTLVKEGKLVWECRGGSPDHVRPGLRLYEIPPEKP